MTTNTLTQLLATKAIDITGNTRNIAIIFNQEDGWFSNTGQSDVQKLYAGLIKVISEDANIIGFQGEVYKNENGLYKKTVSFWPSLVR